MLHIPILLQRSSLSPQVYSAGQKQTVQRVVKSAPSSEQKLSVQDQKIAALTRHGDLKITRKQMPANSVSVGVAIVSLNNAVV